MFEEIAANLTVVEKAELIRLRDTTGWSIPGEPGSPGYDERRSLIAKSLLDGRRGKALSPLGLGVAELVSLVADAPTSVL